MNKTNLLFLGTTNYGIELSKSDENKFIPLFSNFLIVGIIILFSSEFFLNSALWGFKPKTAIFGFLLLPFIFVNSVIAYRLLLYLFPSSILITSNIPNLELFQIKKSYFLKIIFAASFSSLIIWLNFAYHSSCWITYRNILLK